MPAVAVWADASEPDGGKIALAVEPRRSARKRAAEAVREATRWLKGQEYIGPNGELEIMAERWVNLIHIGA